MFNKILNRDLKMKFNSSSDVYMGAMCTYVARLDLEGLQSNVTYVWGCKDCQDALQNISEASGSRPGELAYFVPLTRYEQHKDGLLG